ncbi:hypothetical protein DI272_43860 [Streptomyces sp. Act143]|nr:hypothetical protein DI272_43860 [Streptomyces sp. Act143]
MASTTVIVDASMSSGRRRSSVVTARTGRGMRVTWAIAVRVTGVVSRPTTRSLSDWASAAPTAVCRSSMV